jgi:predicted NBD/HSP70 family sugar kinase
LPAADQLHKRLANRSAILKELHFTGPLRRVQLSRKLNIRKSSITSMAAELVGRGVMTEENPDSLRSRLSLNDRGRSVIVARLSVGTIDVARVLLDGTVHDAATERFDPQAPVDQILDRLAAALARELARSRDGVLGVGLADLGVVDPDSGVALYSAGMRQWRDVPVRQFLEDRLNVAVHVENDVRCQLWGVAWFDRHLRESRNMLYVGTMDAGVAGALLLRGRMVTGRSFCAGEFGHVRAGNEGRVCSCGKTDCLETYCSVPAMIGEVVRVRPDLASLCDAREMAAWAKKDRVVMNVLDRLVGKLAGVLVPILAALDPESLVLGSPDADLSHVLGDLLQRRLQTELMGFGSQHVRIVMASADTRATLRGIGGVVIERCFRSGSFELAPRAVPAGQAPEEADAE